MSEYPPTLEELLRGEGADEVVDALNEAIHKAAIQEVLLEIEVRVPKDGNTKGTRQAFCLDVDPGQDPPPDPEAIITEIEANVNRSIESGTIGKFRLNFRQKGATNKVFRSVARKVVFGDIDDIEEEEEEEAGELDGYSSPYGPWNPVDWGAEGEGQPPGALAGRHGRFVSPRDVGAITRSQAEYAFLPVFQAVTNVGEQRADRLHGTVIELAGKVAELADTAMRAMADNNQQLMALAIPRAREASSGGSGRDRLITDLVIPGLVKAFGGAPKRKPKPQEAPAPIGMTPGATYDSPALAIPSVEPGEFGDLHGTEMVPMGQRGVDPYGSTEGYGFGDYSGSPPPNDPEPHTPDGGAASDIPGGYGRPEDVMAAIRHFQQTDPSSLSEVMQENMDELAEIYLGGDDEE